MKVVAANIENQAANDSEIETLALTPAQLEFLGRVSRDVNPEMPMAFGVPHVIRLLLDCVEQAEIDLADAESEDEVALTARRGLRRARESRGRS